MLQPATKSMQTIRYRLQAHTKTRKQGCKQGRKAFGRAGTKSGRNDGDDDEGGRGATRRGVGEG